MSTSSARKGSDTGAPSSVAEIAMFDAVGGSLRPCTVMNTVPMSVASSGSRTV